MAITIGTATLEYAAFWIDKGAPTIVGSDVRTRTGDMVTIRVPNPSQKARAAKIKIDWAPFSVWRKLYALQKRGTSFSVSFDGVSSYTAMFAADNGIVPPKHVEFGDEVVHSTVEGTFSDAFIGELNLIILS